MTMADTVAVMNAGRIEQMGPPEELYDLPRTVFVANFLGQSNLLPGRVLDDDGHTLGVDVGGTRVLVPRARARRTEGAVLVGIRPEKLHLLAPDEEVPAGTNVVGPGRVTDVSFSGVSTQYQVQVPGLGTLGVFVQNILGAPTTHRGDEVRLAGAVRHMFALDGTEDVAAGVADLDTATVR